MYDNNYVISTIGEFAKLPEMKKFNSGLMVSGILCYISAGITALAAVMSAMGLSAYSFIDVGILLVLGLLIHLKKSRVASILLAVYALVNVIALYMLNGTFGGWLIIIASVNAIVNSFKLNKAWKTFKETGEIVYA